MTNEIICFWNGKCSSISLQTNNVQFQNVAVYKLSRTLHVLLYTYLFNVGNIEQSLFTLLAMDKLCYFIFLLSTRTIESFSNDNVSIFLLPFLHFSANAHILPQTEDTLISTTLLAVTEGNQKVPIVQSEPKLSNILSPEEIQKDVKKKPIKLTMRQGLLMNQVVAFYALENAENQLCKNHSKEFKSGLRAFEPWALQSKYILK